MVGTYIQVPITAEEYGKLTFYDSDHLRKHNFKVWRDHYPSLKALNYTGSEPIKDGDKYYAEVHVSICEYCPIAQEYNLEDDDSPCRECEEE